MRWLNQRRRRNRLGSRMPNSRRGLQAMGLPCAREKEQPVQQASQTSGRRYAGRVANDLQGLDRSEKTDLHGIRRPKHGLPRAEIDVKNRRAQGLDGP